MTISKQTALALHEKGIEVEAEEWVEVDVPNPHYIEMSEEDKERIKQFCRAASSRSEHETMNAAFIHEFGVETGEDVDEIMDDLEKRNILTEDTFTKHTRVRTLSRTVPAPNTDELLAVMFKANIQVIIERKLKPDRIDLVWHVYMKDLSQMKEEYKAVLHESLPEALAQLLIALHEDGVLTSNE